MRSKRRAWPFLASSWILENFCCFYDKIDTYVSRNDLKEQRANYKAAAVQISPASYWIGGNLSFSREVDQNFLHPNHFVNCALNMA